MSSGARFLPLVALVLLVMNFLALPLSAQNVPNVSFQGPINITQGGTYTGNYRSNDSSTPAVTISTTQPVVLQNCIIASASDLIRAGGGSNVTIRNSQGYGLTPTMDNVPRGRFIVISDGRNLVVENNYLDHTCGIVVYRWTGNGSTSETVRVRYNQATNIDGRFRNQISGSAQEYNGSFIGFNTVQGVANMEVAFNQVINTPNESSTGDIINFYNASGTASSPVRVHDNFIKGAYPYPATSTSYSGTGMTTDGDGSSPSTTTAYVEAYNNQFLATSNASMNIAAGHDNYYHDNRLITSSYFPDGSPMRAVYAATSIFNSYQMPSNVFFGNRVENNTIGFRSVGYNIPYPDRHDLSYGNCTPCTGTTHLPNPITLATEDNEFVLWQQKLQQNGITIGASGVNPTTPSTSPGSTTPTTPTAPSTGTGTTGSGNTGSTPMAGPSGYTFFRGLNLNGSAVTLDGNNWEAASGAAGVSVNATPYSAPAVTLTPNTDAARADMIRNFVYGRNVTASVGNVANGTYGVYLYVWEDNNAETYDISVEGQTVRTGFNSGAAGSWQRLGPFTANVTDGTISVATSGGDANLSGIEIWKQSTVANQNPTVTLTAASTVTVNTALALSATAADADGSVAKVEFFNGTTKLGEDTSAPFTLSYTPTTTGTLSLTAKATDNAGGTATSTAVSVTVGAATVVTPPTSGGTTGPTGYTFFRGLNVNGSAMTLDGNTWEAGSNAANVTYSGGSPLTSTVALNPSTDASRTDLIRSFIWGYHVTASVGNVANGTYAVYLYVFEDNNPETYDISVEGQKVRTGFNSGSAGSWQRVGPFTANVTDGNVSVDLQGGAANLSGIEIWKQSTTTTTPTTPPTTTPTTSTLFRAINVNGSATTIDGLNFEAGTTPANVSTNGTRLTAPNVTPNPATDAARTGMLRSFVYGQNLRYNVTNVPNGTYDVAYYFFEDNAAETFSATVNGQAVLTNYNSGPAGTWRKTTPVRVTVSNGQILLQTNGGYANLSGLEIYKVQ
ncbi:Ig-like domain-containing protein [Hymenobacter sp. 15J16-1T3B]|uniref:Ig-like domain-containing protein n=1 Tax=Hymenobacter sp. 15J16-1T3B TaxID=2886941 RepID=UPI001D117CA4|nr:Ig-like domain-containing protein [Hymenobacter sp. 15J16-1T3B]MCC3158532.1 Ig-like domain-containing protein [Hymenobacter sp. 15J16-1T3B]